METNTTGRFTARRISFVEGRREAKPACHILPGSLKKFQVEPTNQEEMRSLYWNVWGYCVMLEVLQGADSKKAS